MKATRILPAIDLIDGQAVRLSKGDYQTKKVYDADPVAVAAGFEAAGATWLHMVDLDGAKAREPQNLDVVRAVKAQTNLTVEFGGGIKTAGALADVFAAGVDQAIIGSVAVTDPPLVKEWLTEFGPERFVLGADVHHGMIAIHGWQEKSEISLPDFIADYRQAGAQTFLCTDVEKDGMLAGSSVELYRQLLVDFPDLKLIASGGVSSLPEIQTLHEIGVDGIIIGKALYEGHITLADLFKEGN